MTRDSIVDQVYYMESEFSELASRESSRRQVCYAINELIDAGHRVVTTGNGYFLALNGDDLEAGARYIEKSAFALLRRARKLRRMAVGEYYEHLGRQAALFPEGEV